MQMQMKFWKCFVFFSLYNFCVSKYNFKLNSANEQVTDNN